MLIILEVWLTACLELIFLILILFFFLFQGFNFILSAIVSSGSNFTSSLSSNGVISDRYAIFISSSSNGSSVFILYRLLNLKESIITSVRCVSPLFISSFNLFFTQSLHLALFIFLTTERVESISISFNHIIFRYTSISFFSVNHIRSPRIMLSKFITTIIYFIKNIKYFFKSIIFVEHCFSYID